MALTSDDKIRSSPRASKDPKSYEYARQMVYVLKTIWTQITFDLKDWEKEVEEARRNKIWERLGYGSIDEVLKEEVGYSKQELSLKIASAKADPLAVAGAPEGNQNAVKKKIDEAKADPLVEPGSKNNPNNVRVDYGNATDYTLRRLARDCPEMLDKIEAGELSVNAAAIAAGIRKKATPEEVCIKAFAKAQNRLQVFQSLISELEPHEVQVVSMWLKDRSSSTEFGAE